MNLKLTFAFPEKLTVVATFGILFAVSKERSVEFFLSFSGIMFVVLANVSSLMLLEFVLNTPMSSVDASFKVSTRLSWKDT